LPRDLIAGHVAEYVVELPVDSHHSDAVLDKPGDNVRFIEKVGDTLFLYSEDGMTVRSSLSELGVPPGAALTREATLEDVFLRLTGRDLDE
jgi:lipooligosaccharide transport system ATP-binding protein